ncbi:unnamed protein product [Protopolystoma xenopodis]|uniref:Uncharacterized protein n=1 Tax=Protopolystoma xenopodis TaxID=117903 RepID=A0A3S5FC90_9PLAT|nr:unnamed protein product [Protopolystoma xenopodis]
MLDADPKNFPVGPVRIPFLDEGDDAFNTEAEDHRASRLSHEHDESGRLCSGLSLSGSLDESLPPAGGDGEHSSRGPARHLSAAGSASTGSHSMGHSLHGHQHDVSRGLSIHDSDSLNGSAEDLAKLDFNRSLSVSAGSMDSQGSLGDIPLQDLKSSQLVLKFF